MPWCRLHDHEPGNARFRLIARESRVTSHAYTVTLRDVLAVSIVLKARASDFAHRGTCLEGANYIAAALDFEHVDIVEAILSAMEADGLIERGNAGIRLLTWSAEQFESDVDRTAAERQRRKRLRDKAKRQSTVTRDSRSPDTEAEGIEPLQGSIPATNARRKRRRGAGRREEAAPRPAQVWVNEDDPRWKGIVAGYRKHNGGRSPPTTSGAGGLGWWFAASEITADGGAP